MKIKVRQFTKLSHLNNHQRAVAYVIDISTG